MSSLSLAIRSGFLRVTRLAVLRALAIMAMVGSSLVGSLRMASTTSTALSLEASPHIPLRILVLRWVSVFPLGMLHSVG